MKLLIYIVLLCAVILIPMRGTDVGQLIPVEVIAISESGGIVNVRTDTGDWGVGATLAEAFADLKDTSPGIIYLDTAAYLLLEPGMEDTEGLAGYLKGNTRVYLAKEGIPLEGITGYLSVNRSEVKLKELDHMDEIPTITEEGGRYKIVSKTLF